MIEKELDVITNPKVKEMAARYLHELDSGKRDFRF